MRARHRSTSLLSSWALLSALALGGCNATPLLEVGFHGDAPRSPPGPNQTLGTLAIEPGGGSVQVVESPPGEASTVNWAHLSHGLVDTPATSLRAMMAAPAGNGWFTIAMFLFVPEGSGATTVQLEPFGPPAPTALDFLRVDLLADGTLRVDGAPGPFGKYPHDQVFVLTVELTVTPNQATATITPSGENTSGTAEVPISAPGVARDFGAVRVRIGDEQVGEVYLDDLRVLRRQP